MLLNTGQSPQQRIIHPSVSTVVVNPQTRAVVATIIPSQPPCIHGAMKVLGERNTEQAGRRKPGAHISTTPRANLTPIV